jgi:ElaB/YqjD/DUF883 family membrane-anchored ribosome-binding protein
MAQAPTNPMTGRSSPGGSQSSDWDRPNDPDAGFPNPNPDTSKPSATDQFKEQAGTMIESAKGLAEEAKSKVQDVAQAGADKAHEAKEAAGEQMHAVADKIRQGGQVASEKADQFGNYLQDHDFGAIGRDLTDVVRKYPVQALLVGIGIGILVGRSAR